MPPNAETFALPTLADLVVGRATGRTSPDQTTFFHNISSIGEGFAAVGGGIYERALERGIGTEIPTSWFLEDIRDLWPPHRDRASGRPAPCATAVPRRRG